MNAALGVKLVQLSDAPPKISQRLLRTAIREIAGKYDLDFLSAEEQFTNTLTVLAHLTAHDRYPLEVNNTVSELLELHFTFVEAANGDPRYSKAWLARLDEAAKALRSASKVYADKFRTRELDIRLFLDIVDSMRDKLIAEEWNPSSILSDKHYALARLIAGNFTTYDQTINS